MKFLEVLKFSKWWVIMLAVGVFLIHCANRCSNVDNGANLNPTEHLIKERIITDKVTTSQIGGKEYLIYQGKTYLLLNDKTVQLGDSSKNHEDIEKKVTTSIFFEQESQNFIYKEEIITKSNKIEKIKKDKVRFAAWSYLGAVTMFVIGGFFILIGILIFTLWLDDLREFFKGF